MRPTEGGPKRYLIKQIILGGKMEARCLGIVAAAARWAYIRLYGPAYGREDQSVGLWCLCVFVCLVSSNGVKSYTYSLHQRSRKYMCEWRLLS